MVWCPIACLRVLDDVTMPWILCAIVVLGAAVYHVVADPGALSDETTRRDHTVVRGKAFKITVGEVEDAIAVQSSFLQTGYSDYRKLHALVSDMTRFELLAAEAKRRGYHLHKDVIQRVQEHAIQRLIHHD